MSKNELLTKMACELTLFLLWSRTATNEELKYINKNLSDINKWMIERRKSNADKQK